MNKTAIKNFAIWARKKLITDITYRAGLMGITEKGIEHPLSQSTGSVQFFDIGTKEPYSISGVEIDQRRRLVDLIKSKEKESDYQTAFKFVVEEVAYTWFNRLIAIRFMEVNDYLPSRIRVLSSESENKVEPDIVTHALELDFEFSVTEKEWIIQLKLDNKLDDLFRMLFIKQCNELNDNLPELFEKTSDYSELLLNVSFTDKDGVVYHLVNDISEDDFNITKEGQIEIIGWLYQYYNTEPKDETFALLKKNIKITKDRIPAATQLFTPEWIVKYMVENSLGRLWVEGHPNEELKANWKYYLEEAEQEEDVEKQLDQIREEYKTLKPEDIKVIDPAMGSGHILVYAFDVLMQIYESAGYTRRDAARSIVENNLYGLDIDTRAYQLAYFAVMMKAREYNRRILDKENNVKCNLHVIQESNGINREQLKYFGSHLSDMEKNTALLQIDELLDTMIDAMEYGSILKINNYNWDLLKDFVNSFDGGKQQSFDLIGIDETRDKLLVLIGIAEILANKYDVVITNPPYMGSSGMGSMLSEFIKKNYKESKADLFAVFIEKCDCLTKNSGFISMITQQSWMFLSSYEEVRRMILFKNIINMIHLGARAFEEIAGEVVQTVSFVIQKSNLMSYRGQYLRLLEPNTQDGKEDMFFSHENRYFTTQKSFLKLPGSPIVYWLPEALIQAFQDGEVLKNHGDTRQGMATSDNNRFIKQWFEVEYSKIGFKCTSSIAAKEANKKWYPYNKGGAYRKWYGNLEYVINYENDGHEVKGYATHLYRTPSRTIKSMNRYFQECISWSKISSGNIAFRYYPQGFIFDVAGCSIFYNNKKNMYYDFGFINSKVARDILLAISPTLNYEAGHIASLPIIRKNEFQNQIALKVQECVDISKKDWDSFETSWEFVRNPLIRTNRIQDAFEIWASECSERFAKVKYHEESLNRIFIEIYKLKNNITPDIPDREITINRADLHREIKTVMSYYAGCIFGRYSLESKGLIYAGGVWESSKYKSFIPDEDNIILITDEEYLSNDIVGRFIEFVQAGYGPETLEENLDFIANALGNKGNTSREVIRDYFVKDFFKDHCKTYQKRPIYWLFDSGKQNGFKALVYMHRYNEDTIGNLRIDYLHKIQRIYENEIRSMQDVIDSSSNARDVSNATKRKDKLLKQLQETKDYDEKIAHLALARTSIDLDDGVKVNYEKVQTDRDGNKLEVLAKI